MSSDPSSRSLTASIVYSGRSPRLCHYVILLFIMSNPSSTLAGSSPANTAQPSGPASTVTSNAVAGPSNPTASTSTPTLPNVNGLANGQSVPQPDDVKMEEADLTSDLFAARREEDLARKDRSLAEFLKMLDGYNPLVGVPSCWPTPFTLHPMIHSVASITVCRSPSRSRRSPHYIRSHSATGRLVKVAKLTPDPRRSDRVLPPARRLRLLRSSLVSHRPDRPCFRLASCSVRPASRR